MAMPLNVNSIFAEKVRAAAKKGALSHAVIVSGEGDMQAAADFLTAAYLCEEQNVPCLRCNACRKVLEHIHPDVAVVEETEKKELAVDTIREMRSSVYIRPNEGKRKVYLFPNCAQLNDRDQNVLLKIVEEGPSYSAFIFCTVSASALLPTVRSRCTEMKLPAAEELPDIPRAAALLQVTGKKLGAARYFAALEGKKMKREELQLFLEECWQCAAQVLLGRRGKPLSGDYGPAVEALGHVGDRTLGRLVDTLRRYAEECKYNVGVAHVLGALTIELSDMEEQE